MAAWYTGDVRGDGLSIHYTRTGGDKPQVVLSHGFSDNGMCWARVAHALEKDYDVIMYDARGHGMTQEPLAPFTSADRAADAALLIRKLRLDRPVVMGHSMGASTSALVAANYPDLVRAAVLEDPGWRSGAPRAPFASPDALQRWREMQAKTRDALIAQCRVDSPTWPEIELQPWAESKLQFHADLLPYYQMGGEPWQETAARITCPTLLLVADTSKGAIVTTDAVAEAFKLIKPLEVVQIQGAGHNIRREGYATYMQAVTEFLRKAHAES
jgi:pimeloyl-ACP methyl ester carboxylesterase